MLLETGKFIYSVRIGKTIRLEKIMMNGMKQRYVVDIGDEGCIQWQKLTTYN